MTLHNRRGRLSTGRTLALLLALVGLIGAVLWSTGYLPLRLRSDGIYGGNAPACAAPDTTIDRPKLYLPAVSARRAGHVQVLRVVDGDTLEIMRESKKERVRLIGLDCDELGNDRIEPEGHAWRATMFVFSLLEPDPQVKLLYDKERLDKYDRTLAYVYLPDGSMLNEAILKAGWARTLSIPPNTRHASGFAKLEADARQAGLGRWQD